MYHISKYYHDLSMRMSDVLHDIGVNETMVMRRRKATLLSETMKTITDSPNSSIYRFGSLSEGTTTFGLDSDLDTLCCYHTKVVIQDYSEWQPGVISLLMIRDENTSPSYCHLQPTKTNLPQPETYVQDRHHVKISSDKVLLQNTLFKPLDISFVKFHGPSWEVHGTSGLMDSDFVPAFHCKSWPLEAEHWLHRSSDNVWPTQEIKKFAQKSGFLVVPVGSKVSQNEAIEWRISTSLAERCLMFSLNITQIRCYILMKMILKTHLCSQGVSHLSSYVCKTVLWYCIKNTQPNVWRESNLISCLNWCLQRLSNCVLCGNCPHFIIPGNNLTAEKLSGQIKQELHENICQILQCTGRAMLMIQIDNVSTRLVTKLNRLHHVPTCYTVLENITANDLMTTSKQICSIHNDILDKSMNDMSNTMQQRLLQYIHRCETVYRDGNVSEQTASILMTPVICSTMGSIIATLDLQRNNAVSAEALYWLQEGMNSDVSSGRLKLASVLYCLGDTVRTEIVLREIERRFKRQGVEPVCGCLDFPCFRVKRKFLKAAYSKDLVQGIRENTAFCVKFTAEEICCIPYELQYEMFRSNEDDLLHRDVTYDSWMDYAVVDSLPYLYFLKYKVYGLLQRYVDQQQALDDLIVTIETEPNLAHKETALNLLGQCMEEENRFKDALNCYLKSLTIRGRNNIAKFHIIMLLVHILVNPDRH